MRFIIMIRRTRTGYSADVPDLPGCAAVGLTVEHTRQQMAEAIEGHLEVMRESGEDIPTPAPRLEFAVDEDADEEYCTWVEVFPEDSLAARPAPAAVTTKTKKKRKQR
jgi:predicted RNase H-like HicB family nuclease